MKVFANATIIRAEDRGTANRAWLVSHHSFSFGRYYNPERMGFRSLRVINDDFIAAGGGFGTHPHDNMEIFSYVLSGELEHQDSMGNKETLRRGDLQLMSAGSGITHSEYNPSKEQPIHMLQIWIEPRELNTKPTYDDRHWSDEDKLGKWLLMLSPDAEAGSMAIRQDAKVYSTILRDDQAIEVAVGDGRYGYLHVADGEVRVDGEVLKAGDALELTGPVSMNMSAAQFGELLFFDLA
ncbi:MAG: pirin family protein [Chthonomonas sp.]|nr:pirin family protein [Chthonomonas sp.]